MNRVPKPPLGFIPVDSEEAKRIGDDVPVNFAFVGRNETWRYGRASMNSVRAYHADCEGEHYHVQLLPAVEWEERWAWAEANDDSYVVTSYQSFTFYVEKDILSPDQMNTIVAALNEMEESNG